MSIGLNALVSSGRIDPDIDGCPDLTCKHCRVLVHHIDSGDDLATLVNGMRRHAASCPSWPAEPYAPARKRSTPMPIPGQLDLLEL